MKVVVTSKENDITVYHCSGIIENYDGTVSFVAVDGSDVEVNKRVAKEIEIVSIYFEGGKS
jgi:hypothetical protein